MKKKNDLRGGIAGYRWAFSIASIEYQEKRFFRAIQKWSWNRDREIRYDSAFPTREVRKYFTRVFQYENSSIGSKNLR